MNQQVKGSFFSPSEPSPNKFKMAVSLKKMNLVYEWSEVSNQGQLDAKCERYLCAVPSPEFKFKES